MKKYFVMLGGNMLALGAVDKLHEFGYDVIVIDWNKEPAIKGDIHVQIDVKDKDKIIDFLKKSDLLIDGALSFIDLAAPTVNAINKWCGNKTMPSRFDNVFTKAEMRDYWEKAGVFNRISKIDDQFDIEEIFELSKKMKLICKPNIAASSRGITILDKNQSITSLQDAFNRAKEISFDEKCLIEEYVEGEEFTVDMLGDSFGNVCVYGSSIQYHSVNALKNHVTVKHHWNSRKYSDDVWEEIADFGIKCYKSIGLNSMFGHLEIIMKEDGTFTPIEMGARSSGFICSHTVSAASGHDYLYDYIRVLHGEKIINGHFLNGPVSSMWYGYDIPANTMSVKETDITEFLDPRISILYERHDGLRVGEHYGKYINDNNRDKFGYAILSAPKDILTIESIENSEKQFINEFVVSKDIQND